MTINFRRREVQQRGKGIGGFFRAVSSVLKPILKSIGGTVIRAAKSNTGKAIGKAITEQALDSALNMTKDVLAGNSLKDSWEHESSNIKSNGIKTINNVQKKRRQQGHGVKKYKKIRTQYDDMKQFFK